MINYKSFQTCLDKYGFLLFIFLTFLAFDGCSNMVPTATSDISRNTVTSTVTLHAASMSTSLAIVTTPFPIPPVEIDTSDEYLAWLFELNDNSDCILPCWWGIQIDNALESDIQLIFEPLHPEQFLFLKDRIMKFMKLIYRSPILDDLRLLLG